MLIILQVTCYDHKLAHVFFTVNQICRRYLGQIKQLLTQKPTSHWLILHQNNQKNHLVCMKVTMTWYLMTKIDICQSCQLSSYRHFPSYPGLKLLTDVTFTKFILSIGSAGQEAPPAVIHAVAIQAYKLWVLWIEFFYFYCFCWCWFQSFPQREWPICKSRKTWGCRIRKPCQERGIEQLIVIEASEKAMWCKQIIFVILVSFTSLRWQAKASYKCKNYRQFFICGKLHLPKTRRFSII